MKNNYYIKHILLCLALLTSTNAFAYDACIDGIYYNFSNGEATVTYKKTRYNSYSGEVTIPSSVIHQGTTYSVTSIGDWAFSGCDGLTSITIPNSVTSIGIEAFKGCSGLTSVSIPNSVTRIGQSAFQDCTNLASVTIPSSVTSIGTSAFSKCYFAGTSFVNNSTLTSDNNWGARLFDEETSDGLLITDNIVKKCRRRATSVTIPNSVTSIGDYAFEYCSGLTSVTIPNSVTSIGDYAFMYCSGLTSVSIPSSVTSIGDYAFEYCSGLTSVTIGSGVTSIGRNAFMYCSALKDVYCFAENVPATESNAFPSASISSATLHVPDVAIETYRKTAPWSGFGTIVGYTISFADAKVKAICLAKWDTNGDNELDIFEAAAVTDLGSAFNGKSEITSFDELRHFTGLTTIGYRAFYGCSNLTSLTIPASVTNIGNSAFSGCSNLTSVSLPESLTSIGGYVFQNCSSLTSINIPQSVTSIGGSAFSGCSGLTSINIPQSVTSIGGSAFSGCSGLTAVHISDLNAWCNISFGNSASQPLTFAHHLYLNGQEVTKLVIPNGVTSIGNYAFAGCSELTTIKIPYSVTSIGSNAFSGCSGLKDVYCYTKNVPAANSTAFSNASIASATLHVPELEPYSKTAPWSGFGTIANDYYINFADANVKAICVANWDTNGDGALDKVEAAAVRSLGTAFYRNGSITSLNELQYFIGLTSVGAFGYCSSLTSIIIPESVTSIDSKAFIDCSSLTSIIIPNRVTEIGSAAFSGCSNLTSVSIGNSVRHIDNVAFKGCKLHNVLIKCTTVPKLEGSEPFMAQTYYHTTLYIPVGTWDVYAYDEKWYQFINIRETAMSEDEVSEQSAYTLMDAGTFAYSVYDPVNDCIGTINSAGSINEDNPNHSWQMMEAGGLHYLYNIGAKKYAKREGNSLCLCDEPTPIDVADGDNGLILAGETSKQWALVSNERLNASQAAIDQVTGIKAIEHLPLNIDHSIYNMSGQRLSKPQKGLNIVGGRKVLMK